MPGLSGHRVLKVKHRKWRDSARHAGFLIWVEGTVTPLALCELAALCAFSKKIASESEYSTRSPIGVRSESAERLMLSAAARASIDRVRVDDGFGVPFSQL